MTLASILSTQAIPDALRWTWAGGYNIISGPVADLPMLGIFLVLFRKHNCHVRGCPRIIWKDHDGHSLCRKHHPSDVPTASDL